MSKRASEGLWRRRREALCLGVIACAWGAPAWAEPIPAHWRSIPPVADRAGVQASLQEVRPCPDGQAGECLTLRVSNTHSFPVVLEELIARPLVRRELYAASAPVEVHAGGTLNLVLPLAPPEVKAWKDIAAFPVAFRVRLSDAQLGRLEALGEGSSPKALSEGASLGMRMEALGRAERGVWAQRGTPTQALDAQLERLGPLLPKLIERGCAGQVEALGEVHGRWRAGEATHDEVWASLRGYVEWRTSARWEPRLLGCATPEVHAQAVALAMWVEWDDLAQEISEGFKGEARGATPEPFRGVLLGSLARRLRAQEEAALGEPPDFQDPTIIYRPLMTARAWEHTSGEAFPLERRLALWEHAFKVGHAQLERARPEGAQMVFHMLEDERAQLVGRRAELEALERVVGERGPALEFEQGRFLFHTYLWDAARWPEIRASLQRGASFAPMRSRVFLAGLWAAEHQRWVVGAVGLLLGGLALFGFSRAGERSRLRAWVWLTGRGGPGAWRALVRLSGLSAQDEADARLRAAGARRLMEVGRAQDDPTLAEEAAGLLAGVKAAWRPEGWRVGADAVVGLARGLDEARGARLAQVALDARLVERVFSGVGSDEATVLAARSLGGLARCGQAREARCAEPESLREALEAARAALKVWEGSPKVELAPAFHAQAHGQGLRVSDPSAELRARVGVWTARLGPRWGLEGSWGAAWEMLGPLAALPTGVGEGEAARVVEARLMAASEVGTTREALGVLGWARGLGASQEAQAEALWTMAQRASLWAGEDAAPWEAWEALDGEVAARLSPARGLAARLRLLALRRLASQTEQGLWGAGWDARSVGLLGEAKALGGGGGVAALACVLDLLVEGDGGFDEEVAQAQGAQRAWFLLTRALDHMAGGRPVEAATALFEAEPQRLAPKTGARLWAARAVVAGSMGQRRAAREALGRAVALGREAGAQVLAAVDEAAAQLVGLLWAEDDGRLLERAALGWLGREGLPPVPWWSLAARLAPEAEHETVLGLLRRSEAQEPEAGAQRRPVFSALARRAVREGDYTRASACAILATADERGFP